MIFSDTNLVKDLCNYIFLMIKNVDLSEYDSSQ